MAGVEAVQEAFKLAVRVDSTSEPMRPLNRSTMPLVWGVRGRVWRYSAPSSAQTPAKRSVKQLPLSVSTAWCQAGEGAS